MLAKIIVAVLFGAVLVSLASALVMMIRNRDTADRHRLAKALTVRVGLSIALFIILFILFALGIIRPHGLQG